MFLSAIMILSMVAGSAALAGSAAATQPDTSVNSFDELGSELRYAGQSFDITDTSPDFDDEAQVYLAEIAGTDDDGNVNSFGTVVPFSDDSPDVTGEFRIEDFDLEGVESGTYVVSNASSYSSSTGVSDSFSVQEQDFGVNFDDDSVTGQDNESAIELNSQNRPSTDDYNVTVRVDGPDTFDNETIYDLFGLEKGVSAVDSNEDVPLDYLEDYSYEDDTVQDLEDDGYVTINLSASNDWGDLVNNDDELVANFSNLADNSGLPDAGEYEFEFIVADTGATATDTVQIDESDESGSFTEGAITDTAGDIATFEFELEDTDETWIQIGDEESDFVEVLYIQADDENEPVEVSVNTRLLGTDASIDQDVVYDMENVDSYESGFHETGDATETGGSAMTSDVALFGDDSADDSNYASYIEDDLGLADNYKNQLTRPLQPTDYGIQIGGTDVDSDEPVFDAENGGEATDQIASAVLELQPPQIGDITVHTAPGESADDETEVSELVDAATVRDEVALEDRLVVQVEATGIYGGLVAGAGADSASGLDANWDRLSDGASSDVLYNFVDNTSESVTFEVVAEETTGNQDPLEVKLDTDQNADTYVVLDEENGQFFLIADTSSDGAFANGDAPEDEVTFTADLEYDADNEDDRFEFGSGPFSAANNAENYPYLLQGETLSSSTEFDMAPRSVEFDHVNVDDVLEAENIEDSEISGTTNVAPGTDGEIRVSSADGASSTFRNGQNVNISEDGSISAEFDFSGLEVADQFTTNYRVGGSSVGNVDSMIVEEGTLEDEAPEEDDESEDDGESDDGMTEDGESDDGMTEDGESDDGESTDDGESDDSSSEETPGFGAIVALVAVLGAALLATRRQN